MRRASSSVSTRPSTKPIVSNNYSEVPRLRATLKTKVNSAERLSHGFLILDKPTGITSANAVAQVKRLLACKKIGHGGTLDPLASGVLPLAIGEATKAFDYIA